MTKKIIYGTGKVYSIRSSNTDKIYIGSTFNPLCKRLYAHKSDYKLYQKDNTRRYISSFEIIECGDYYIELLEEYNDLTRDKLKSFEGLAIRETENCVNKRIAGRTAKEYFIENKEELNKKSRKSAKQKYENESEKQKKKDYYLANKEKILKQRKDKYISKKKV